MFRRIKNKYLRYFLIFIYAVIIFFCSIELNFLWLFGYSPDMQDIKNPALSLSSEVYYADGTLIGRYFRENRSPVEFKQISPNIINALVATEDVRFYKHNGVDFYSFFTSMLLHRQRRQARRQHHYTAISKKPVRDPQKEIAGLN